MFHFSTHTPQKALNQYLDQIFYARGVIEYDFDKILPTGKIVLIINLGHPHRVGKSFNVSENSEFSLGWLTGVQTSPLYNLPTNGTHVVGCLFSPLGFYELFGLPQKDWVNRVHCPATFFSERTLRELISSLGQLSDDEDIFCCVEDWLLKASNRSVGVPSWFRTGFECIVGSNGEISLQDLYSELDVSGRHFNTKFQTWIGPTPKQYCRILRLNQLLNDLDPTGDTHLTDVAHKYGFSDQSHFNREFKNFTGISPNDYFSQRKEGFGDIPKGKEEEQ